VGCAPTSRVPAYRRARSSREARGAAVGAAPGRIGSPRVSAFLATEHGVGRLRGRYWLVEVALPVARYVAGGTWRRLVQRMVLRWRQWWAFHAFVGCVVVEPLLARLEAADDRVAAGSGVSACVLARRRVTTADVAAASAAAQVEPPSAAGEAFDATVAARRYGRVNSVIWHAPQPTRKAVTSGEFFPCAWRWAAPSIRSAQRVRAQ